MEEIDWFCKNCNGEGRITLKGNGDKPEFVICGNCNYPSAYIWCNICGMGGQLAENSFHEYPQKWQCSGCKNEYQIFDTFYNVPILFSPIMFLPNEYIEPEDKRRKRLWNNNKYANIIGIYWISSIVIMFFLLSINSEIIKLPELLRNIVITNAIIVTILACIGLVSVIVIDIYYLLSKNSQKE
jgi:hypothetical protein